MSIFKILIAKMRLMAHSAISTRSFLKLNCFFNLTIGDATSNFVFYVLFKLYPCNTTQHTNFKLNTINQHAKVRVTQRLMTSLKIINFLQVAFFDRGMSSVATIKTALDLPTSKTVQFSAIHDDVTITNSL